MADVKIYLYSTTPVQVFLNGVEEPLADDVVVSGLTVDDLTGGNPMALLFVADDGTGTIVPTTVAIPRLRLAAVPLQGNDYWFKTNLPTPFSFSAAVRLASGTPPFLNWLDDVSPVKSHATVNVPANGETGSAPFLQITACGTTPLNRLEGVVSAERRYIYAAVSQTGQH